MSQLRLSRLLLCARGGGSRADLLLSRLVTSSSSRMMPANLLPSSSAPLGGGRDFHSSAQVLGRKGGASAFEKKKPPSVALKHRESAVKRSQKAQAKKMGRIIAASSSDPRERQRRRKGSPSSSSSTALMDPEELLDPEFGQVMDELLAPIELKGKEDELLLEDPVEKRKEMMLRELESGKPCPIKEYNRLIRIFTAHGRYKEALQTYQEMQQQGLALDVHSLTALLSSLGKAGQMEKAEEMMMEAEATLGIVPDAWAWSALITGYVKNGKLEEGLEAFKRMKLAGHTQDLAVCTIILEAIWRMKGKEKMMDFWLDMRFHGIEPDAVAYTVMMKALVKTGDVERAVSLLDEMEAMSVQPNIITYNTILMAAAESPLWFPGYNDYVYEVLGRLESSSLAPNAKTYEALLRLCARAGNALMAERYLIAMKQRGFVPDHQTYHQLLRAYAMFQSSGVHGGKIPKALSEAKRKKKEDKEIVAAAGGGGRGRGPLSLSSSSNDDIPDEIDLKALIRERQLNEGKKTKKFKKALAKQEAAATAAAGTLSSSTGAADDSIGGSEEEEEEQVRELLRRRRRQQQMEEEEEGEGKIDMIGGEGIKTGEEGQEGDRQEINALVPRLIMKEEGDGLDVLEPDDDEEGALVLKGGLLETLPTERQRVVLEEEEEEGSGGLMPFAAKDGQKVDLIASRLPPGLTVSDMQEINIHAATAVLEEMKAQGLSPTIDTMNHYLAVHAEALRLNRALEVLHQTFPQEGIEPDQRSYYLILRMLVRAKRLDRAFEFLQMMMQDEEKGIIPNVDSLGVIMEALGRRGQVTPALHLLEVMTQDLGYTPKEWHVRPLRRAMKAQNLSHPLMPKDPRAWLMRGFAIRRKPEGREVRRLKNFLKSSLTSVMA